MATTRRNTKRESYDETAARREKEKEARQLKQDLRDFASARPEGWSHDDWLVFLDSLKEKGHDTSDPDAIGLELERERLAVRLEQIQGMGPRRVDTVVERFNRLWELRQASEEEIASLPSITRPLAEKIKQEVG